MPATITRPPVSPTAALSQLAHESPDAVCLVVDQRIAYANPALGRLLGGAYAEDLIGRRFLDFAPDTHLGAWERLTCDGLAAEFEPMEAELPLMRMDASVTRCWVSAAGSRMGPRRGVQLLLRRARQ